MDKSSYRISSLQTEMQRNKKQQMSARIGAIFIVLLMVAVRVAAKNDLLFAWIVSVLCLLAMFLLDVRLAKANKACEFKIYFVKTEDRKAKQEIKSIMNEVQPDAAWYRSITARPDFMTEETITVPNAKEELPIAFYGVLLAIDLLIRVI